MHKAPERKILCEMIRYKRYKEKLLREMRALPDWEPTGEQINYTEAQMLGAIWEIETCIDIFRKTLLPYKHWKRRIDRVHLKRVLDKLTPYDTNSK